MKTKATLLLMIFLLLLVFSCTENNVPAKNEVAETTQTIHKLIASNGEITGASYVAKDGSIVKMEVSKELGENGHHSQITIFKGNEIILTLQSGVDNSSKGLGKIFVTANGLDVNFSSVVDASTIFLEKGKASSGIAKINTRLNEENWNGSFDFGTSMVSKGYQAPSLYEAIPTKTLALMEPFNTVIDDMATFYKNQPHNGLSNKIIVGQPVISSEKSAWGTICRAACWGAIGAIGAACCAESGGLACPWCMALAGADAAMCADLCPD